MNTDRIEKNILIRAPLKRLWRALTDHREFGEWFGIEVAEPFKPGTRVLGKIVGTKVDPEISKIQQQFKDVAFEMLIEKIEPMRRFAFKWHPGAADPKADYSGEPMTLVEFVLEEVPEGVLLTVTESGFDRIPLARRAQAFSQNEQGWSIVVTLIDRYVRRAEALGA